MSPPTPSFITLLPRAAAPPSRQPLSQLHQTSFTSRPPIRPQPLLINRPSAAPRASAPPVNTLEQLQLFVKAETAAAITSINAAQALKQVNDLRVHYLGKKGTISSVMRSIGKLAPDERPHLGAIVNKSRDELSALIQQRIAVIEQLVLDKEQDDDWIDVTMPGIRPRPTVGRVHPITGTMDRAVDIFAELGYEIVDDPELNREIETDYHCFEALNCPPDHPAREMQDTFYLTEDKSLLLRTQTSAVQIRYMEQNKPPFRIIAPGRVFRRDTVDATHTSTFHQIEILAVDEMGVLNFGHLRATVIHFLEEMLGKDIKTRFRGSYFPFTEPSVEVDVFFKGRWLEVLGCGMVDPDVLEKVGLDSTKYSGFAAGFGVERFAMVMHDITDIRELYLNDMRFIMQGMKD